MARFACVGEIEGVAPVDKEKEPQSTPNTQMGAGQDRLDALSRPIIGCALMVMRGWGIGFLEKVHENAFARERRKSLTDGHAATSRGGRHDDVVVRDCAVDLFVETIVLGEPKLARAIDDIHRAQRLNDPSA